MKQLLFTLILLCSLPAFSQKLSYRITENNPPKTPQISLNVDLFQLDMFQNTLDGWSFNVSAWGHVEVIPERIGVQYLFRRGWFSLGKLAEKNLPPNNEIELGAYYVLSNNLKTRKTKITLKVEESRNYINDRVRTETYIVVPSVKKKMFLVRGGFYKKSLGNSLDYLQDDYSTYPIPEWVKYRTMGLYAGFAGRTFTSVFANVTGYGNVFTSIGTDLYFDVLFLPVNTFIDLQKNNVTETVKKYANSGPLGFRVGYKLYQIDPREKTDKMFGLSANFETGVRPHTGFFMSAGIGLTLIK